MHSDIFNSVKVVTHRKKVEHCIFISRSLVSLQCNMRGPDTMHTKYLQVEIGTSVRMMSSRKRHIVAQNMQTIEWESLSRTYQNVHFVSHRIILNPFHNG